MIQIMIQIIIKYILQKKMVIQNKIIQHFRQIQIYLE